MGKRFLANNRPGRIPLVSLGLGLGFDRFLYGQPVGISLPLFVGLLAAPEGIKALQTAHPDVPIHIAQIDSHLNDIGFIVPGLGDAGDRQFGTG